MARYDFKKGAKAKITNRSERLLPGDYVVEIKKCTAFEARDKTNYFTSVYEVLETTNEKVPEGVERGWMQDLDKDAGPGALKGFVVAALGLDHTDSKDQIIIKELEDDEEKYNAVCVECIDDPSDPACKNSFRGVKLRINVTMTETKAGEPFTKHTFGPFKAPKAETAPAPEKK